MRRQKEAAAHPYAANVQAAFDRFPRSWMPPFRLFTTLARRGGAVRALQLAALRATCRAAMSACRAARLLSARHRPMPLRIIKWAVRVSILRSRTPGRFRDGA